MKNWLFSYIFSRLDNICKLMLSGICTLFHQTSPTFSYAYGPEESLLVPDFLQFMCTAVHAIFSFLASLWLLRFLFLFMYSTSIPKAGWNTKKRENETDKERNLWTAVLYIEIVEILEISITSGSSKGSSSMDYICCEVCTFLSQVLPPIRL